MNRQHHVLNSNRMVWRRKDLRSKQTLAEGFLWKELRNNKLGCKFKRQYSVMNYVIDFYCHKAKLAIELDGKVHKKSIKYDGYRTKYLESLGISEVRFNNDEVCLSVELVLKIIKSYLPPPEIRRGTEGEV